MLNGAPDSSGRFLLSVYVPRLLFVLLMGDSQMENRIYGIRFVIDEHPCCVWDWDPKQHNDMFIENFQPTYFRYIAEALAASVTDDNEQLFAIATRSTYSQALETLFALVGATLQAPDYVLGWLLHYRPDQLKSLIEKICVGEPIKTLLDIQYLRHCLSDRLRVDRAKRRHSVDHLVEYNRVNRTRKQF